MWRTRFVFMLNMQATTAIALLVLAFAVFENLILIKDLTVSLAIVLVSIDILALSVARAVFQDAAYRAQMGRYKRDNTLSEVAGLVSQGEAVSNVALRVFREHDEVWNEYRETCRVCSRLRVAVSLAAMAYIVLAVCVIVPDAREITRIVGGYRLDLALTQPCLSALVAVASGIIFCIFRLRAFSRSTCPTNKGFDQEWRLHFDALAAGLTKTNTVLRLVAMSYMTDANLDAAKTVIASLASGVRSLLPVKNSQAAALEWEAARRK